MKRVFEIGDIYKYEHPRHVGIILLIIISEQHYVSTVDFGPWKQFNISPTDQERIKAGPCTFLSQHWKKIS